MRRNSTEIYNDVPRLETVQCAGIIAAMDSEILLVQRQDDRICTLGFVKGRVRDKETNKQAAVREGREETKKDFEDIAYLGRVERTGTTEPGKYVHKRIDMYLGKICGDADPTIATPDESETPVWATQAEVENLMLPEEGAFILANWDQIMAYATPFREDLKLLR